MHASPLWTGQVSLTACYQLSPVSRNLLQYSACLLCLIWFQAEGDAFANALFDVGKPSWTQSCSRGGLVACPAVFGLPSSAYKRYVLVVAEEGGSASRSREHGCAHLSAHRYDQSGARVDMSTWTPDRCRRRVAVSQVEFRSKARRLEPRKLALYRGASPSPVVDDQSMLQTIDLSQFCVGWALSYTSLDTYSIAVNVLSTQEHTEVVGDGLHFATAPGSHPHIQRSARSHNKAVMALTYSRVVIPGPRVPFRCVGCSNTGVSLID